MYQCSDYQAGSWGRGWQWHLLPCFQQGSVQFLFLVAPPSIKTIRQKQAVIWFHLSLPPHIRDLPLCNTTLSLSSEHDHFQLSSQIPPHGRPNVYLWAYGCVAISKSLWFCIRNICLQLKPFATIPSLDSFMVSRDSPYTQNIFWHPPCDFAALHDPGCLTNITASFLHRYSTGSCSVDRLAPFSVYWTCASLQRVQMFSAPQILTPCFPAVLRVPVSPLQEAFSEHSF